MTFGEWLIRKRKEAGLTQGQLAARAGISTSYVSTLERNQPHVITNAKPQPAVDVVEAIARALGADENEAKIEAGYFGEPKKPRNAAEFLTAIESLHPDFDFHNRFGGIEQLTPDEYQSLLEDIDLIVERMMRRKEL